MFFLAPWPWNGFNNFGRPHPLIPESPRFRYAYRDFNEARSILQHVALNNGHTKNEVFRRERFRFEFDFE
jgi:hypothetical protein